MNSEFLEKKMVLRFKKLVNNMSGDERAVKTGHRLVLSIADQAYQWLLSPS
jgi:hypothetical protein